MFWFFEIKIHHEEHGRNLVLLERDLNLFESKNLNEFLNKVPFNRLPLYSIESES